MLLLQLLTSSGGGAVAVRALDALSSTCCSVSSIIALPTSGSSRGRGLA
jgi:hypothetical protein